MMGTGITLSERFKGLNPWKLSSVEEEFGQKPTSTLSLSDVLKLSSLAITVNGKTKNGHPQVESSKKSALTSLHKLFSQKAPGKEAKTGKVKSTNGDFVVELKKTKSGKVPEKTAVAGKPSQGKAPTDGSKQTNVKPSKEVNLPQNSIAPSTERPRDPRLLYGKGPYSILAKKPAEVSQSDKPEIPASSEKSEKSSKFEVPVKAENPVKKKRSFGESLTSANGTGLEAIGKKSNGEKTIHVVRRNVVTKKITGVMEMNAKRKPLQSTDQNKPSVTEYHSSHNALKRIAEAKKAEEATVADVVSAEVITPQVIKGIIEKDITSVDSVETNGKRTESAGKTSTQASVSEGKEEKGDKSKQAVIKQSANAKMPVKAKAKGSKKVAKPKIGVKNKTVSMAPNTPNIVLQFSITPTIDNGKLNFTLVSSSGEDQEKSDSNQEKSKQEGQTTIPFSVEDVSNITASSKVEPSIDEPKELDKPKQAPVTDEELKKGSPIQVRISNSASGHTPRSSTSGTAVNKFSHNVDNSTTDIRVEPEQSRTNQTTLVTSRCVYTTARKTAQVSAHQSVVKVNNQPPVPITYVYGTVVNPNKTGQVSAQPARTCYQSGYGFNGTQVQQFIATSDQYTMHQNGYQGSEFWHQHQSGIVTQPDMESIAPNISQTKAQGNISMTGPTPVAMQRGSNLLGQTDMKEDSINQPTTECMPISVHIQQSTQNAKKVTHNDSGCKPVHRTLTAIARASETEKATSDNLDVVDMDISTPAHLMPDGAEGMPNDSNVVPSDRTGNGLAVPPSQTPDERKNVAGEIKESQTTGKNDGQITGSSGGNDEENESNTEYQQGQHASWTTYLHEDTNSPMKSAFGSKQSFTEALTSLQKTITMETSNKIQDRENSTDEATSPDQVVVVPKDASPSVHLQPATQINATSSTNLEDSVPKEANTPPSPVSMNIPSDSGKTFNQNVTIPPGSDIPKAIPDTSGTSENSSGQNPASIEVAISSKDDVQRGIPKAIPDTSGTSENSSGQNPTNIEVAISSKDDGQRGIPKAIPDTSGTSENSSDQNPASIKVAMSSKDDGQRGIPKAILDTSGTSENSSGQNPASIKVAISSKDDGQKGNNLCSGMNQLEEMTVPDGRCRVSDPEASGSAELVEGGKLGSDKKIGEVSPNTGIQVSSTLSKIIINRGTFEGTMRRSKSPGTPVEDEYIDQDPFGPSESMKHEMHNRNENVHVLSNGVHSSMRCEEKNNNFSEKEHDSHHQHMADRRDMDQSDFPRQYNRASKRYPHSPRNQQGGPVYMRELSNVSDISMGDEEFEPYEDQSQEALEPLLVRGSTQNSRGMDHFDYPRHDSKTSRREAYEDDRKYSGSYMSINSHKEIDPLYRKPVHGMEGYDRESIYSNPYTETRDYRYEAPDRPNHMYRDRESPNAQMYMKNDGVPSRRDAGEQFQRSQGNPMVLEQMTAVQALQLQINAAVNPAHRAALIMALQALTGRPVQPSSGEPQPEVKMSSVSLRPSEFRDTSDEVSSKRFRNDSVQEDPSHRKVEFTVVLNDDAEQLLRKDNSKKSRAVDHTKVQRNTYDAEDRYSDASTSQHPHDSNYYRTVEFSSDPGDPDHDGIRKDRALSHENVRIVELQRGNSEPLENPGSVVGERLLSGKTRNVRSVTPEERAEKQKKSNSKKSKKKAKDFHGRPLIKDKTNRTDPHSIPLEREDTVRERNDPRRSLTPDPAGGPKELRPLNWPPTTPVGESKKLTKSKDKKHKHKEKRPRPKSVAVVPSSVNLNRKPEETLHEVSSASTLAEGSPCKDRKLQPEASSNEGGKMSSEGTEQVQKKEVCPERKVKPVVEQNIEAFVNEARRASKQMDVESKEENINKAENNIQDSSSSTIKKSPLPDKTEQEKCILVKSASSEDIINEQKSEDEKRLDTSRESAPPRSISSGGKKKSKSPESKKHKHSGDDEATSDYEQTPQKRKLSERSPERHRKYRHSWNDREKSRHKRKYSSDSESDIDSDREHVREPGDKFKRYGHFSRFTKRQDWRSERNGPFKYRSGIRRHTPFSRFDYRYKKYIYPGNLGKPYGNKRTYSSYREKGDFRGCAPVRTPWRKDYVIDITKEVKNTPTISMAALGYKSVEPWEDVHVALSEVKTKMLAVENSSREVRKASALLQVAPLLEVRKSSQYALECIMEEVSSRIPFDRREMYLHRRKYEILLADARIHAEVLGKLVPPELEEEMLSQFVPNTTGIPRIQPQIELKVMNWLRLMNQSGMMLAVKDLIYRKIHNLEKRVDALREMAREGNRLNRHGPRSRQRSGSDRSPDTTRPECGYSKDSDHSKSETSPEVVSCPELCANTPEMPVQPVREPLSEIRLPTHHHVKYPLGYLQSSSSTAFRDPPEPVRKLISSSNENLGVVDIPVPLDDTENVSFSLVDILPNEDQTPAESDQNAKLVSDTNNGHATEFLAADTSSVDVKGTQASQILSPQRQFFPPMLHESATPPCTSSSFRKSFKQSTSPTYPPRPQFYISRVQRLASQTLMSPESGTDLQTLLKSEEDKNLKRSKIQRSLSCSEEPSSQKDVGNGKPELKSPRYSKKRHFLEKFQSDGHDGSVKSDFSSQCKSVEPTPKKIRENNLNEMYDEYDESCLVESRKADSNVLHPSPPTSNSESGPSKAE